jgi:signal transduction histidine kinase
MGKDNFNFLPIIRYIVYFVVAGSIILVGNVNGDIPIQLIVYLLLYIINAQLRIYFLKKYNYAIIISLLVEIFIIYLLSNFGGFTFIYYFVAMIDVSMMLPKFQSTILNFILYAAVAFQSMKPFYKNLEKYPLVNIIFNTVVVIGFVGLGRYINEQRLRKAEAQKLYDKLRVSEQELKEAYERLEQYSNTIEELTILRERNRISREIHDTVGHTLSTLVIQLQALPYVIKADSHKGDVMIENMVSYTKTGIEDVRRAVRELNPSSFDKLNGIFVLQEFINNFQKNCEVTIRFSVSKFKYELTSDQSFTLYRILQESLNNATRHGKATLVEINLNFTEKDIYLYIKDNGIGTKKLNKSFGLSGMEQRIKKLGGEISFNIEKGFEINILLPKNQKYV